MHFLFATMLVRSVGCTFSNSVPFFDSALKVGCGVSVLCLRSVKLLRILCHVSGGKDGHYDHVASVFPLILKSYVLISRQNVESLSSSDSLPGKRAHTYTHSHVQTRRHTHTHEHTHTHTHTHTHVDTRVHTRTHTYTRTQRARRGDSSWSHQAGLGHSTPHDPWIQDEPRETSVCRLQVVLPFTWLPVGGHNRGMGRWFKHVQQ